MAHLHRFYLSPEQFVAGRYELSDDELRHAISVVRLKPGEQVLLFDGEGRSAEGRVETISKKSIAFSIEEVHGQVLPFSRLFLFQAALHRTEHLEFILSRAAELGVMEVALFRAEHSERALKYSDRWRRIMIETCKQCGHLWLPKITLLPDMKSALDKAVTATPGAILLATKDEAPIPLSTVDMTAGVSLLIGPEGDFTDMERTLALQAGAKPISLGNATYRSEMAATYALSLIQYALGNMGPL